MEGGCKYNNRKTSIVSTAMELSVWLQNYFAWACADAIAAYFRAMLLHLREAIFKVIRLSPYISGASASAIATA